MKELYSVQGILNKGFVGQLTYTVCLGKPLKKLDIYFAFDKRRYTPADVTPELVTQMRNSFRELYGAERSEEEMRECILRDMKAEIHTLATVNDEFIGCIHRQLDERHMTFDGEDTAPGCIPQERFEGVLKVTLLVFNVILDGTHYTLTVSGEEEEEAGIC